MKGLLRTDEDVLEARARIFRALGDQTRLRIYQTIVEADQPINVTEISERTGLATNLVSHHLKCLSNCTLVRTEKKGRQRLYSVARTEGVRMLELADDCIKKDIESVLGCEITDK